MKQMRRDLLFFWISLAVLIGASLTKIISANYVIMGSGVLVVLCFVYRLGGVHELTREQDKKKESQVLPNLIR